MTDEGKQCFYRTKASNIIRKKNYGVRQMSLDRGRDGVHEFVLVFSEHRRLPAFPPDLHQRGLFVREGDLPLLVEADVDHVLDEPVEPARR